MAIKKSKKPTKNIRKSDKIVKPVKVSKPIAKGKPKGKGKVKGSAKSVSANKKGPKLAVFIDLDNTNASRDNLLELFSVLERKGDITYGKLYGYSDSKVREFEEIVAEHRLETAGRSRFRSEASSIIDTRLLVDCLVFAEEHETDMIFIWAGMGDLIPVFTRLIHLGCHTITVDLPDFDCNNKFVDEKIKLFSPHASFLGGTTRSAAASESVVAPKAAPTATISALGGRSVPQLPRKKGAPEFGASMSHAPVASVAAAGKEENEDKEDIPVMDDFSREDFDVKGNNRDDGDDEEDDDYDPFADSGKDVFTDAESERMLAMTDELLLRIQEGKFMDIDEIRELDKATAKKLGVPGAGKILETAPAPEPAKKASGGYSGGEKYDIDEDNVKEEPKPFEKDDFSDFGDL